MAKHHMDIGFRAKKILGNMDSFVSKEEIGDKLTLPMLPAASELIGVYVNDAARNDIVIITREWVGAVRGMTLQVMRYADIEKLSAPAKSAPDGISVQMKDGRSDYLRIANGNGQFRDVYEFTRFMMRAVEQSGGGSQAEP